MNAAQLKRSLTPEDVTEFVTKVLKSDDPLPSGEEDLRFQTICHNPPHTGSYKLYYYSESQLFRCYTDCSETFDIYELIQKAGYASDFLGAYQLLCEFMGYSPFARDIEEEPEPILTSDWDLLSKIDSIAKSKKKKKQNTRILPQNLLEFYSPCIPAVWYDEGISWEAMKKFGVRMDIAGEKAIIPHYDFNGNLIGIRARNFNDEDLHSIGKYMPVTIGLNEEGKPDWCNHPLGDHLYGLNFNREAIARTKQVVVFEAEKSVLKASTYYGDNNYTVAVCGSALSETQVNLLLSLGVEEIVIAFDNETDGFVGSQSTIDYKNKIEQIASQFAPYVNTYYIMDYWNRLGYKDSPIDRGKGVFEFLLKRKILVQSVTTNLNTKTVRKKK